MTKDEAIAIIHCRRVRCTVAFQAALCQYDLDCLDYPERKDIPAEVHQKFLDKLNNMPEEHGIGENQVAQMLLEAT